MIQGFIQSANASRPQFTAGDLREGLELLPLVYRRAILFGLEQRLDARRLVHLLRDTVETDDRTLTPFATSVLLESPRHPVSRLVFWRKGPQPLLDFESQVSSAFGGMTWGDLARQYKMMTWFDHGAESDDFITAMNLFR